MADTYKWIQAGDESGEWVKLRLVDNGDETYSLATGDPGGGGGGATTIADGGDATQGAKADAAAGTDTATASQISLFKRLLQRVTVLIGQLPAALTGAGNLKTALQEAIPAGTNNIGDVDVLSMPAYTVPVCGELAGNVAATPLPNVPCQLAYLKARANNAGNVYIGRTGVTKPDGTTDTTTGIELAPGDLMVIPIDNLNRFYHICDNAGDALTYVAVA